MVSLESALASVNLDNYIQPLLERNYNTKKLLDLPKEQLDTLAWELQMKNNHLIRLKNLLDALRPIHSGMPQNGFLNSEPQRKQATNGSLRVNSPKTLEIFDEDSENSVLVIPDPPEFNGKTNGLSYRPVHMPEENQRFTVVNDSSFSLGTTINELKNALGGFLAQKDEIFKAIQFINQLEIDNYVSAVEDLKRLKDFVKSNFGNQFSN